MSRSKRVAPDAPAGETKGKVSLFLKAGRLRAGWRLAAALAAYAIVALALRQGLNRLFRALFAAWNVNAATAARAPGWAAGLYAWHGSIVSAAVYLAVLGLSMLLRRWWGTGKRGKLDARSAVMSWAAGTGAIVLSVAVFLMLDSIRPMWPLGRPNLTGGLIALWLLTLLGALAEETFTKTVVFDGLSPEWGAVPAGVVSVAAFFLMNGGLVGGVVSAVNVALLGTLCCLLYVRKGLWTTVAFRWGFSFALVFLAGYGGGGHGVYRFYGVSETALTGGDAGFMYGTWMTILLACAVLWMCRSRIKALLKR